MCVCVCVRVCGEAQTKRCYLFQQFSQTCPQWSTKISDKIDH